MRKINISDISELYLFEVKASFRVTARASTSLWQLKGFLYKKYTPIYLVQNFYSYIYQGYFLSNSLGQ